MRPKDNIVDKLREKIARAVQQSQRGVIVQPGAIGDCILTLPLAEFMKDSVCRGGVDMIGHTECIGILPGRSCVDAVRSTDSIELHRLFTSAWEFELADPDESGLISAFGDYTWIATFLGEPDSDFEQNLIFTVNCSHSAEVMTLSLKPPGGYPGHLTDFYREQFVRQSGLGDAEGRSALGMPMIRPSQADMERGREILAGLGIEPICKPVIIHPGSGGAKKCWHLDNFLAVGRRLARKGADVMFLLGPAEVERMSDTAMRQMAEVGRRVMNLPLAEVLSVLSCAKSYVGNDSGITHLSAALGVRTVAVFGPTDPAVYGPIGPAVTIVRSEEGDFAGGISEHLQQQVTGALA